MKIVLLEFTDEAKILLKKRGKFFFNASDVKVVCLHPKVRVFLKKKGIYAEGTDEYLNNDAQHRIILKTGDWTQRLLEIIDMTNDEGIRESYRETCAHHFGLYVGHMLWILELLKALKEKVNVKEFHCCLPTNRAEMYSLEAYLQDGERYLGFLTKAFCLESHISFKPVFTGTNRKVNFFISLMAKIVRGIRHFLISLGGNKWPSQFHNTNAKTIVVPALSYRMGALLRDVKNTISDCKFIMLWDGGKSLKQELFSSYLALQIYLKNKSFSMLETIIPLDHEHFHTSEVSDEDLWNEHKFEKFNNLLLSRGKDAFSYDGICLGVFLAEKVASGLKTELIKLQRTAKILTTVFKSMRPRLIMSMYSTGPNYALGEVGNNFSIPTLIISHGTHVPPHNEYEEIENLRLAKGVISNSYRYVAVQTPWTEKFLDYYRDERERIYTGPLLYSVTSDRDRETLRREILGPRCVGKIIVHATTQKSRTGHRFHITETMDEYLSTLTDLIRSVNEIDGIYLIVRPHPVCNLTESEYRSLLPKSPRMFFIAKGSFSRVLSAADLLVSYASTCIEEALQNKIPVLLYDKWKRYNHFNVAETVDLQMSRSPVYYFTDAKLLSKGIPKILDFFTQAPLSDHDLEDYCYPKSYRSNFYNFVRTTLEGERETSLCQTIEEPVLLGRTNE